MAGSRVSEASMAMTDGGNVQAGTAYVISAGMIGFAFVRDHTRGAPLALVIVMLVIFALDVPLVIAFTVARYSSPQQAAS
jgi:hypothetical protein